ncbi:MAG: pantetheine-phosphate adenylyltransferase, partial [Amnibacterium sp.]
MVTRVAVIPGSFDPVTLGHLDIVKRAAPLFDRLHVLVTHNPGKAALLPFTQRVSLLQQSIQDAGIEGDVVVESWSVGLLVDYCVEVGAQVLVKGIRSATDTEYETPMAMVNRDLAGIETLFLIG